mmetsp:Transcript_5122/g.5258  ORF Transcript_5122/g.5258 Transcript_5122/m.5258 type:complete len:383 (-) Transcript_5122:1642-2790(-)|eukprot:CAMPEP_0119040294 /NCGR_PEP_ID=MMETSP1177-20130426/10176_1 /TAXON_ID=2985 /ORGANISM="Ochromonas sp, Strain CCMP1899" /LENGTH=382 /DNA_ID=CAMNT_0007005207 /DNA_START=80 /DNA_END=1228 /DNA_ORIENTATION=-
MASSGDPNWLGLLQWSLANTDGTSPSPTLGPMAEEDKKWLEAVMKANVKDEPARMTEIMNDIVQMLESNLCCENEERIEMILEELRDITEQIDMAQIFVKFGGLTCLIGLLQCKEELSEDVRCLAVGVMGTLSQNNFVVQEDIYKKGTVDFLASVCLVSESFILAAKVLYAISCMVRNHPLLETHFGIQYSSLICQRAVALNNAVFARRATFLSTALITSDHCTVELLETLAPSLIPGCFSFLNHGDVDLRETTLGLLVSLAKSETGRVLLVDHSEDLNRALIESPSDPDPELEDQHQFEQQIIADFRAALLAPICIPLDKESTRSSLIGAIIGSTIISSQNGEDTIFQQPPPPPVVHEEEEVAGPILLLQAPVLDAASPAP